MIAARLASTVCMPMKFSPRYSAFWQMPNRMVAYHCLGVSRQLCPIARAMATPIRPDSRKRAASE